GSRPSAMVCKPSRSSGLTGSRIGKSAPASSILPLMAVRVSCGNGMAVFGMLITWCGKNARAPGCLQARCFDGVSNSSFAFFRQRTPVDLVAMRARLDVIREKPAGRHARVSQQQIKKSDRGRSRTGFPAVPRGVVDAELGAMRFQGKLAARPPEAQALRENRPFVARDVICLRCLLACHRVNPRLGALSGCVTKECADARGDTGPAGCVCTRAAGFKTSLVKYPSHKVCLGF